MEKTNKQLTIKQLSKRVEEESKLLKAFPISLSCPFRAGLALPTNLSQKEADRVLEYINSFPELPSDTGDLKTKQDEIYNRLSTSMHFFLYGVNVGEDGTEDETTIPFHVITVAFELGRYAYIRKPIKLNDTDMEQFKSQAREAVRAAATKQNATNA